MSRMHITQKVDAMDPSKHMDQFISGVTAVDVTGKRPCDILGLEGPNSPL